MSKRVLYLFICGAGPASRITDMVTLAHADGWSVYCVATPAAVEHFLDIPALERATSHQVRTTYRKLDDEPLPKADGVIVAPATYNTINKWAAGICDTYALNQLAELTGLRVKIVVLPFVNQALAANRVFTRSVEELQQAGVRVLFGPGEFEPHTPRTGEQVLDTYPWSLALKALNE
jgi:phosphopantothenoylcysteine synthetase/decarboxylase